MIPLPHYHYLGAASAFIPIPSCIESLAHEISGRPRNNDNGAALPYPSRNGETTPSLREEGGPAEEKIGSEGMGFLIGKGETTLCSRYSEVSNLQLFFRTLLLRDKLQ